jgi:mannose-6-phosphate isomerase-like protein (cupin superfamily)
VTGAQTADWTEADLRSIAARFVMADEGSWKAHPAGAFEIRSMGLEEASDGLLGAYELRGIGRAAALGAQGSDLHFLYILEGSVTVDGDDGETILGNGDAVHHGPGSICQILNMDEGTRAVEITSPGLGLSHAPRAAAGRAPQTPALVCREGPDRHVLGNGPRPNVIYRQLGVAEATSGRYRMQVNRAAETAEGMLIWHYHNMAQWFVVLDGWARVEVASLGGRVLRPGDALTVGAGSHMRHNVADIGEGFQILELCLPADYETYPSEPPQ